MLVFLKASLDLYPSTSNSLNFVMPRAIRGACFHANCITAPLHVDAANITGVLVECDPSIKSIIVAIDSESHEYIVEDLDEQRVVVKENMVAQLKKLLEEVSWLSKDHPNHWSDC